MQPLVTAAALAAAPALFASPQAHSSSARPWCQNVVVPQSRVLHVGADGSRVEIRGVTAEVVLADGIATTTLFVDLANPGSAPAEAELLLPVPDGAVVSGFDFQGAAPASTAELLPKDAATSAYDSIVATLKDPALLEFVGSAVLRSSVFPVPAQGTQRVRVVFENVLPTVGARWDYELPRSESLAADVPWTLNVEVRSQAPLADVWSPSHDLETTLRSPRRWTLSSRGPLEPSSLRLAVLPAEGPVTTTLFSSADPDGAGGWFLLLAGVGAVPSSEDLPPREVTLVLDRSGSMGGEKFDQAVAAASQVIEGLEYGEAFQIIDYSADIASFAAAPVVKTKANIAQVRAYLASLRAGGGTNLDGALQRALTSAPTEGFLPVVLFLTDGLPTNGETREHVIRERAERANTHGRRIFTFGVGNDVNAPLLDAVAAKSRGRATTVRPGEDVELAVASVFEDLSGPVVTDLAFEAVGADGQPLAHLVRDVYPGVLPDLYRDGRLLLVGRYTGPERVTLRLRGTKGGEPMTRTVAADFGAAKVRNRFVPRLWAMRRIAALEDELRQRGADPSALAQLEDDPELAETVGEMLQLSTEFGVLTDTTAFLAREGTKLGDGGAILAAANVTALQNGTHRSGEFALTCQDTIQSNRSQGWVGANAMVVDSNGQRVVAESVQTIQGRTYFRRGARWIDGRIALAEEANDEPDRVVVFGSAEYAALIAALAAEGSAGQLALDGEILIQRNGETILVRPEGPRTAAHVPPVPQHPVD